MLRISFCFRGDVLPDGPTARERPLRGVYTGLAEMIFFPPVGRELRTVNSYAGK